MTMTSLSHESNEIPSASHSSADPLTPIASDEAQRAPVPGLFAGKIYHSRYILLERIAIGGMGEVWKARDAHTNERLAIKILRPEFAGQEQFLSRLRVEASNASRLKHPHLAQIFDSGEEDGLGWIAMELVEGQPLTRLLKQQKVLPLATILPILRQTADALSAVHSAGIVHRDIKPGNILVAPDNHVKLTDFGISRANNQVTLTAAGMVMGTAQYLPPEQAMGQPATPAGDLYALGVIAYEALCGYRPFTGDSQVDIAFAHVNSPVPPMPETIPASLRNLIMRLLSKKPSNRPPTAAKLSYLLWELEGELLSPAADSSCHSQAESGATLSLGGGTVPAPLHMPASIAPTVSAYKKRLQLFHLRFAAARQQLLSAALDAKTSVAVESGAHASMLSSDDDSKKQSENLQPGSQEIVSKKRDPHCERKQAVRQHDSDHSHYGNQQQPSYLEQGNGNEQGDDAEKKPANSREHFGNNVDGTQQANAPTFRSTGSKRVTTELNITHSTDTKKTGTAPVTSTSGSHPSVTAAQTSATTSTHATEHKYAAANPQPSIFSAILTKDNEPFSRHSRTDLETHKNLALWILVGVMTFFVLLYLAISIWAMPSQAASSLAADTVHHSFFDQVTVLSEKDTTWPHNNTA